MAEELDGVMEDFPSRPLDRGLYPFMWLDAVTQWCRKGDQMVNIVLLISTAANNDGCRELLGFDVFTAEDENGTIIGAKPCWKRAKNSRSFNKLPKRIVSSQ